MAKPTLLDYQKQGLGLQKAQTDLLQNKPFDTQAELEALDDFKGLNQEKKSPWQAILDGMMAGAKYGLKAQDFDKKRKVFETLEAYAMAAKKQNEANVQKEQERATLEPYAHAASEVAFSNIPYEQGFSAVRDTYNRLRANHPELVIDGDPIGYIPKSFIINIRDKEGNIQPFDLSSILPEETKRRLQDNTFKQELNDIKRLSAETAASYASEQAEARRAYAQNIQNSWDPNAQYTKAFGAGTGKEHAKRMQSLEEQNAYFDDQLWKVKELKQMLKGDQVIMGDNLNAWLQKTLGKQFNTQKMSETESYNAIAQGLYGLVRGAEQKFGNTNMKEFAWVTDQTPTSIKTKAGAELILDRLEHSINKTLKRNQAEVNKMPQLNQTGFQEGVSPHNQITSPSSPKDTQPRDVSGLSTEDIKKRIAELTS